MKNVALGILLCFLTASSCYAYKHELVGVKTKEPKKPAIYDAFNAGWNDGYIQGYCDHSIQHRIPENSN